MSSVRELLTELCSDGVEFKALGEVGELIRGRRFTKADYVDSGLGSIHYGEVYTSFGTWTDQVKSFVRPDLESRLRFARPGDLIIAATGESVEEVGKAVAWLGDGDIAIHDDCYILRHSLDPKFIAYFFQSSAFHSQKARFVTESKLARIAGAGLAAVRIPVPSVAVQRAIAEILDDMGRLEAELETELKAELDARVRQYGHYRTTLLTFEHHGETEWSTLGELVKNLDSKRRPVTKSARIAGSIPYYGANGVQDHVAEHLFEGTFLLLGEDGSVMTKDRTPVVNWAEGRIWVNNHAHVLQAASERLSLRFLYHYLHTVDVSAFVTGGTQPKLNQRNMNTIPVPVPPRGEQNRIVGILDTLSTEVSDLSAGLLAETLARRNQYEYYRDKLLTFQEKTA